MSFNIPSSSAGEHGRGSYGDDADEAGDASDADIPVIGSKQADQQRTPSSARSKRSRPSPASSTGTDLSSRKSPYDDSRLKTQVTIPQQTKGQVRACSPQTPESSQSSSLPAPSSRSRTPLKSTSEGGSHVIVTACLPGSAASSSSISSNSNSSGRYIRYSLFIPRLLPPPRKFTTLLQDIPLLCSLSCPTRPTPLCRQASTTASTTKAAAIYSRTWFQKLAAHHSRRVVASACSSEYCWQSFASRCSYASEICAVVFVCCHSSWRHQSRPLLPPRSCTLRPSVTTSLHIRHLC